VWTGSAAKLFSGRKQQQQRREERRVLAHGSSDSDSVSHLAPPAYILAKCKIFILVFSLWQQCFGNSFAAVAYFLIFER
jgi:hypothetical protein